MRTVRHIIQKNVCVCVCVCVYFTEGSQRITLLQVLKVTLMDLCRTVTARARSLEKEDGNRAGAEETINRRLEKMRR